MTPNDEGRPVTERNPGGPRHGRSLWHQDSGTDPFFTSRRDDVASRLQDVKQDGSGFEARCPECGHGGFRVDKPDRTSRYPHIWACACQRCNPRGSRKRCTAGVLRVALLRLGISPAILGPYDGPVPKDISPETARNMDLAIRDILACPGLKPAEIRLVLADAIGRKPPDDYTGFVKYAGSVGISRSRAQDMAAQWCRRPPDCPLPPEGGVVDTSRYHNSDRSCQTPRSETRDPPKTGIRAAQNGQTDKTDIRRSDMTLPRNVQMPKVGKRTK